MVLAAAQAVDFVRKRLARCMAPQAICEAMCDHCLAPDTQVSTPSLPIAPPLSRASWRVPAMMLPQAVSSIFMGGLLQTHQHPLKPLIIPKLCLMHSYQAKRGASCCERMVPCQGCHHGETNAVRGLSAVAVLRRRAAGRAATT